MEAAVMRLVQAFGDARLADYFACFAADATFVFYTWPEVLMSVAAYRALWEQWIDQDGLRVLGCRTFDTQVQLVGEVAVVTHSVETLVMSARGEETLRERETIVLKRQSDGRWLGIHEHLSPMPSER